MEAADPTWEGCDLDDGRPTPPLDSDFDAEEEPVLQLPPGWHIVVTRGGVARLAWDLPDIAEYDCKRTA